MGRQDRGRVGAAGDGPVDLLGHVDQSKELSGRGGAVGVDEPDHVGVAVPERLHDHPALAQLGELVQLYTGIHLGMGSHHVGRAVGARVERDQEAGPGVGHGGAVGAQGPVDAGFFVESRDHNVDAHRAGPPLPCIAGRIGIRASVCGRCVCSDHVEPTSERRNVPGRFCPPAVNGPRHHGVWLRCPGLSPWSLDRHAE